MSVHIEQAEGGDRADLVHFATQQTRYKLLLNILSHPDALPSLYELQEMNPSLSQTTIYNHVEKLVDAGIVREVRLQEEKRQRGLPWKFYGLSHDGKGFLAEHNLLPDEDVLQRVYGTVTDKSEKMERYENAPRPDVELP